MSFVQALRTTSESQSVPPRGFRIKEAALYMGLSPWAVEILIRSKKLPALKICRHYTVLREDMDAFLDSERAA
jgi:excisionase family DNA binding protein